MKKKKDFGVSLDPVREGLSETDTCKQAAGLCSVSSENQRCHAGQLEKLRTEQPKKRLPSNLFFFPVEHCAVSFFFFFFFEG